MSEAASTNDEPQPPLYYDVDPALMAQFAKATVAERLRWLDETRAFLIAASTPEVRANWAKLRGRPWLSELECDELRRRETA